MKKLFLIPFLCLSLFGQTADQDLLVRARIDTKAELDAIVTDATLQAEELAKIGTPTFTTIQHMQNTFHSAGHINGGAVTVGAGETVNLAAGTGYIRVTDSSIAQLPFFDWSATASIAIPTNATRWLGISYNAGSPTYLLLSTETFDYTTNFPLAVVTNEAGTIYISNEPFTVGDHASLMIRRIHEVSGIDRDNEQGGITLDETGTRNITVSAGALWNGMVRADVSAFDSSASGTFNRYYRDGSSGHTKQSAQTQWDNLQWDDGDGGLATLGSNKWANQYFWETLGGAVLSMYGTVEHNSQSEAENENIPTDLPDRIRYMATHIGHLTFKKSDATAAFASAFEEEHGGSNVTNHNNLSNNGGSGSHAAITTHITEYEAAETILTLATGVITRTQENHILAAETGTTDDLITIDGLAEGDWIHIVADSGDTITVHDNTGLGTNIDLGGILFDPAVLDVTNKTLSFRGDGTNAVLKWVSPNVTTFLMPISIGLALSDESTDLTTGTAKVTIRAPYAFTLTGVRTNVNTAPTGSTLTVDVNEGGVSVLSTVISIDASEKTSTTAATPPVISDSAIADDAELTFDIDQIGSTIAGKGLKIWLIGTRSE